MEETGHSCEQKKVLNKEKMEVAMCILIWLIVSIAMLTITIWVHRHTYETTRKYGEYVADLNYPVPFPMWFLLSVVVVSFIPILNTTLFIIGIIIWSTSYADNDIRLGNLPKWFKSVQEFLTKQV